VEWGGENWETLKGEWQSVDRAKLWSQLFEPSSAFITNKEQNENMPRKVCTSFFQSSRNKKKIPAKLGGIEKNKKCIKINRVQVFRNGRVGGGMWAALVKRQAGCIFSSLSFLEFFLDFFWAT